MTNCCSPKEYCSDPYRKGNFWERPVPAHCNLPVYECIVHYLPVAAGECSYQTLMADECICHREGWKDGDVTFF